MHEEDIERMARRLNEYVRRGGASRLFISSHGLCRVDALRVLERSARIAREDIERANPDGLREIAAAGLAALGGE